MISYQHRIFSGACQPWQPFQCPDGDCIPLTYICDGRPDCNSGYDENDAMCTACAYVCTYLHNSPSIYF